MDRDLLRGAWRTDVNGWIRVHTEGGPYRLGYQNGYLLAAEVADLMPRIRHYVRHTWDDWAFFRQAAQDLYQPRIPEEYAEELAGVLAGLRAAGIEGIDLLDIIALNGYFDTSSSYYYWRKAEDARRQGLRQPPMEEHGGCSALCATGSYTADGGVVVAHNTWVGYMVADWRVLIDVHPEHGHRFFMQSWPGTIHSGTDFYINDQGLVVTETTITGTVTMRPEGTPYFVRARSAIQRAGSIDQWMDEMRRDNNGGYANDWMIADARGGEIAVLEMATEHERVWRTTDGCFVGCNVAQDPQVRTETRFDYDDPGNACNARHLRWSRLVEQRRGQIDAAVARAAMADHLDVRSGTDRPGRASLCGHVEMEEQGLPEWDWGPSYPGGAIDGLVTDRALAAKGQLWAHWGKPCDTPYRAAPHLDAHPAYAWQRPFARDLDPYPWTLFTAGW